MPKFTLPKLIELQYQSAISDLLKFLMPPKYADQSYQDWVATFAAMGQKQAYKELAHEAARRMVAKVDAANARSWREASAKSQRSRMLYNALMEELGGALRPGMARIVDNNARLIHSIPGDVAAMLNRHIVEAQQQGLRPGAVHAAISAAFPKLTHNKVKLIARTQTQAASTDLTEARALDIGLQWFEWDTSEDQRVRPSHKKMAGVLCSWHDLPSPEALIGQKATLGKYAPGRAPNCRCIPSPILTLDDVSWPARVYHAGQITRMTRTQFQLLTGIPARRKAA